jgi:hypothetical protein
VLNKKHFAAWVGVFLFMGLLRAEANAMPSWMTWDVGKKETEIWLRSAYNGNNGSWNYNGYYEGGITIVVPFESRVVIHFENPDGKYAHSVLVTRPFGEDEMPDVSTRDDLALPRAYSNSPEQGCLSCKEDLRFKAGKVGDYYLFCGVVGHGRAGMWIGFEVSESATEPHVTVAEGVPGADDQPPWQ